ncbi:MAG: DUF6125 family protein [Promethearchaeota archaeon]
MTNMKDNQILKKEKMNLMSTNELKELLIKSWMTHDGMWFYHCLKECGIEKTNIINKAASRSLGKIEIKRFKKAFNIDNIKTFEQLKEFIDKVISIVKADFMKFSYNFSEENEFHFKMHKCFAYEGINRIGVLDDYKCGIFDRIEGWFETLGIPFHVSPKIDGCLIYKGEKCIRNYKFSF